MKTELTKKISVDAQGNKNVDTRKEKDEYDFDTGSYCKSSVEVKSQTEGNNGMGKEVSNFSKQVKVDGFGRRSVDIEKERTAYDFDGRSYDRSFDYSSQRFDNYSRVGQRNDGADLEVDRYSKRVEVDPRGRKSIDINKVILNVL